MDPSWEMNFMETHLLALAQSTGFTTRLVVDKHTMDTAELTSFLCFWQDIE